ncbi:MAG: hypothetical protein IPJ79_14270 [Bacteroidetes bacterium]|nr:hypothetical protein [Bacteroidota bacterium]
MKTKDLVNLVLKNQKWIYFVTVFSFCLSIYLYYLITNKSTATVSFLIPSSNSNANVYGASDAERFAFNQQSNINSMRILELIYSDEMITYINDKFNLYDHYYIDKYNKYSWNMLKSKFQKSVGFMRESDEKALVSFTDADAIYAADVANEILIKLIDLNRNYVLGSIKQRGELYESMIGGINADITTELSKMQAVVSDFKAQSNLGERNIDALNLKVDLITNEFGKLTTELVRIKQYYAWSQIAIENNLQNNLVIINKAIPDKKQFYIFEFAAVGITTAFIIICLICLMFYFYAHARNQWITIMGN